MAPRAASDARIARRLSVALVAAGLIAASSAEAKSRHHRERPSPDIAAAKPEAIAPPEISGAQYSPVTWTDVSGWAADDALPAFKAFRISCVPILAQRTPSPSADAKALGTSLREPCLAAKAAVVEDPAKARGFFEEHFVPARISRLGEDAGFVTGYYEPIVDGSRTKTDAFTVPLYRRPSNLFVRGFTQASASLPNKGDVFRKIGRRKLVPYYDRASIEDGAIAGRGLEIVWLKSETDLLFIQIQGSARIRVEDGPMVRVNYDAHNGYPYTPVGRVLIERNIVPREQMSMQKIREYMDQNPGAAAELRRQNRSFVFFREVSLGDNDEAVGAQGVPLTAGRSIAVDRFLHVYGTPFFVSGDLPTQGDGSNAQFARLMIGQDTGSAIVGPARADIYFGAGTEAGRIAGRLKNPAQFVMLMPKSLDPLARGKTMPLPPERPSAEIAKLFPVKPDPKPDEAKEKPKDEKPKSNETAAKATIAQVVPLPVARPADAPKIEPIAPSRRVRKYRRYR